MEELEFWQEEILKEVDAEFFNSALSEPAPKYSTSKKYQDNILLRLTFELALASIKFTKHVKKDGYGDLAHQLFRSATSIGANAKEAQNAESKADFVHKLKIALKEADETEYWLFLCENLDDCKSPGILIEKLSIILKILTKIISTSKTRMKS
jgi:four helix bundle protein